MILEREVFHFVHQSQRSVEIVPVRILHGAFDVLVGSAGTPTKFLATAFHPQIVMRTDTCTQGFAQPVGIRTCRNFAHTFGISLFEPHIVTGSRIIIIKSQIPFQLQFLCSIQQIIRGQIRHLQIYADLCIYPQFTGFRLFGRHDNDTVGTTRTVDCCCCSIFQNIDALNFLIVVVHQALQFNFKTIHDNQWRIDRIIGFLIIFRHIHGQGRITANVDLRHSVRVTTVNIIRHQIDGNINIFQRLQQILSPEHLQLLPINGRHGTRVTFPCFLEDTGYYHFIHFCRVLLHHHIDLRTVTYQFLPYFHAQHGEDQRVIPFRQSQRVLSVHVRRRAHCCTFQHHGYARQGRTVPVLNHTGDFSLLRCLLLRTNDNHVVHNPEGITIPQYLAQGFFQGYVFTSHSNFTTGFNLLVAVKEIQVCLFLNRLDGFLPRGIHQIKVNTVRLGVCARTHPQHSQEEQKEC